MPDTTKPTEPTADKPTAPSVEKSTVIRYVVHGSRDLPRPFGKGTVHIPTIDHLGAVTPDTINAASVELTPDEAATAVHRHRVRLTPASEFTTRGAR